MEQTIINNDQQLVLHANNISGYNQQAAFSNKQPKEQRLSTTKPFIVSNTEEVSLQELKHNHIIPVYVKDNEPLVSHYDFIEAAWDVAAHVYGEDNLAFPSVRVSHPIKGRVPEARKKPASELQEWEKTIYYERAMFLIEIPCNYDEVDGNVVSLTIGGVKAYNLDNLYNRKGAPEHFKVFIGFKNQVCCNLCVSTDGLLEDVRVTSALELRNKIYELVCRYNALEQLTAMQKMQQYYLTERQFAHLIGRCKMYQYLSPAQKKEIPELHFGDSQINQVCRDYYRDESFCRDEKGSINIWKVLNLFTESNKSSYIDTFLSRAANASNFTGELVNALENRSNNWFIS